MQKDQIKIGEEARKVLSNDAVKASFDELENYYINTWKQAETTEIRERNWHMLKAVESLRSLLNTQTQRGIMQSKQSRRNKGFHE